MSGIPADAHSMGAGATPSRHIPRAGALLANHHQQQAPAPPPESQRSTRTYSAQDRITLAALAVILTLAAGALWRLWSLEAAVRGIWTVHDQERFIAETQHRNPGLLLPSAYDIIARRLPGGAP
jgi:hypothetical protein